MKTLKSLSLLFVICLVVFSCGKDDNETDPSNYPFAKETVDEGKSNIEDAGQQMITEMQAMQDVEAGNVLESFINCNTTDYPFDSYLENSVIFSTISASSAVIEGKNNFSSLLKSMKSDVEKDTAISQIYNKFKATYTWNFTNQVWVKSASSEFKFIFPSTKGGTTNNATMVITYTGKTGLTPIEGYNSDLPATFNTSIKVNSETVFEIDLKASYNSDGLPTSVNYFVAMYPYKYEITWSYSNSSVSLRNHFTNDSKTVIDCYQKMNGNFSMYQIESEDTESDDIFSNGNAYFQVFNIKLAGSIDYKNLNVVLNNIEEEEGDFQTDTAYVSEMNKYVKLDLVYADTKQKIASAEIYPSVKTREYYDWNTDDYVTEKYASAEIRFIFADGSKGDLETYFSTGFSDFINDLNEFMSK
jgi:hypothetical protein